MATKIGGKYLLHEVQSRHWVKFAGEVRLPPADIIDTGRATAATLPTLATEAVDDARAHGLNHPILHRLIDMLNVRSAECARVLETATA